MHIESLRTLLKNNEIGLDWLAEELKECEMNNCDAASFTLRNGATIAITIEQMRELLK